MLLHALYERLCMAPLNRLPCYGALEVIVTLLLLLLLLLTVIRAVIYIITSDNQHSLIYIHTHAVYSRQFSIAVYPHFRMQYSIIV